MKTTEYDIHNKLWEWMTYEEEKEYYAEILERVIANPRYYLDNLDDLYVFRVSFLRYDPEKTKDL